MGLLDRIFGRRKRVEAPGPSCPPAFTVIDVETTGLSPRNDRVVELALVHMNSAGQLINTWASRFNPDRPVGATHIHGITEQDVASAPRFHVLAPIIASALHGTTLVAHNAAFDLSFLRKEFDLAGWDLPALHTYCTLEVSAHYLPHLRRRRLPDCCAAVGVPLHQAHSALGDATATAHLLHRYLSADVNARQSPPWSPIHAALSPPRYPTWPTQGTAARIGDI